jgi:hypothetical protein
MSKKVKEKEHSSIFDHLINDDRKKDQLRKVLKKFDKSLEDYVKWKKDKYI